MNTLDYETQALSYRSDQLKIEPSNALMALTTLGLVGEAGEVAEIFKKAVLQGHTLDPAAAALELGDILWYIAVLANQLGITLDQVMRMNLKKLERRYSGGFSLEKSLNRENG